MEDGALDQQKNHDAAFVDDSDYHQQPQTTSQPVQSQMQSQQTQQVQQQQQQQQQFQSSSDERCNLIINYIPMNYNEERLKQLFSAYGTVESCKLMIDKQTKMSLGYGFVKYTDPDASEKAIEMLNGKPLENKVLKVAYAKQPTGNTNTNLYVANLDAHLTKDVLESFFAPYGTIIDSKILYSQGQSRGVGFIRFETKSQAEAAINALNGALLPNNSNPMIVKYADTSMDKQKKKQRPTPFGAGAGFGGAAAVVGGGGSFRTQTMSNRYDPMRAPPVMGYSNYTPAVAPTYGGYNQASVVSDAYAQTGYCIFIYHLPPETDENVLYRLFGPFGAIASVKVVRDQSTGQCKGFGFVNFIKLEDSQQAIINMNGYQLGNKVLQVSYKTPGKKQ